MRVIDVEYGSNGIPVSVTCEDDGDIYSFEIVKHGKWIPNGDDDMDEGTWHCSECKYEIYTGLSHIEEAQEQGFVLYCEHCGTKMDLEESK